MPFPVTLNHDSKKRIILVMFRVFNRINSRRSSRWDRYLGMTAPMTQVPVPTATEDYTKTLQRYNLLWEFTNFLEKKINDLSP